MRVRCPSCHRDTALWRGVEVPGWQAIKPDLEPTSEKDIDWTQATPDGVYGCGECQWEGGKGDLERVSEIDGERLPTVARGQDALPV